MVQELKVVPIVFQCPTCGQPVTRPLTPLPDGVSLNFEDSKPAIPEGFFTLSDDDYWTGSSGCPLINLADLVGTKHHPDAHRNNGCCGLDGCDGPNLICELGHEVGTEKSDCWMAHAAVLLSTVSRRPAAQ